MNFCVFLFVCMAASVCVCVSECMSIYLFITKFHYPDLNSHTYAHVTAYKTTNIHTTEYWYVYVCKLIILYSRIETYDVVLNFKL